MLYTADYLGYKTSVDGKIWTQGKSVFNAGNVPSWWNGRTTSSSLGWVYDSDWDWNSFIQYYLGIKTQNDTVNLQIIGDAGANITYCE